MAAATTVVVVVVSAFILHFNMTYTNLIDLESGRNENGLKVVYAML